MYVMRVLVVSWHVRFSAVIIATYWIIAQFAPGEHMILFMSYLVTWVSIMVIIAYMPNVFASLEQRRLDRIGQLTLGIVLAWVANLLLRLWGGSMRLSDDPALYVWMKDSPFIGFCLLVQAIAGVLHITAPGAIDGRIPTRNWVMVGVAVSTACLLAGIIIGMNLRTGF